MDKDLEALLERVDPHEIYLVEEKDSFIKGRRYEAFIGCGLLTDRRFEIAINLLKNADEWAEMTTLLHEIVHYLPKYKEFPIFGKKTEDEIDKDVARILREEPEVLAILLSKLREAKALDLRISILKNGAIGYFGGFGPLLYDTKGRWLAINRS